MPRFGTRSLLLASIVVALWLSTLTDYSAAHDVRSILILMALLVPAFNAVYSTGRTRAFWAGFFVFFLACAIQPKWFVIPNFNWLDPPLSRWAEALNRNTTRMAQPRRYSELLSAMRATVWIAIILPLSALFGSITAHSYDRQHRADGSAPTSDS